ncbi:phytanoyl-CoA dioxygenase family protein [Parahaliea mediterranea]|uniref:phytanoyl-CoA dioxygenase family protein n=1 Tax=Parahaliea mediterranea TaxID=651086 RepID=UPI000E2E7472|nr:phytanoyl-CoA dioxygenase family protein [Parahaliea mediterranea]
MSDAMVVEALGRNDYPTAIARLESLAAPGENALIDQFNLDLRIEAHRHMRWPELSGGWPAEVQQPPVPGRLADIPAAALDVETLRAGVLGSGGVIVRELLKPSQAEELRQGIDRVLAARHAVANGQADGADKTWYGRSRSVAGGPVQFGTLGANAPADSGSVWAVDSPVMALKLISLYRQLGLPALLHDYFGEDALLSVKKWVLRKVKPNPQQQAGWHQDGRFLGDGIRTVNMWIALSDCGGDAAAPGMDIIPASRRVIHETGTQGAAFDWTVGAGLVAEIEKTTPAENPRFRPGDALFFDEFNLHRTGFAPHHTAYRYAVESWFFAASRAPAKQQPVLF